jgi:hypothetical protein
MTDALISLFDSKYHYTFWRPETAIAEAGVDDNPRTDPDVAFKPFITTPCHPSYPAGASVTASAAHRVLERTTVWVLIPSRWPIRPYPT